MESILFMYIDPKDYLDSVPEHVEFLPKRMTIACQREGKILRISAAHCSPEDQFSRRKGREVASKKISMNFEIYRTRMEYYRAGKGTKPVGFHHVVVVENMTDENCYDAARTAMKDFVPQFLEEYSGMKTLHNGRLMAAAEMRLIKDGNEAVTG